MSRSAVVELVVLAALWGASFLFMRVATPEFGPVPLIGVRVAVAAVCLAPVLVLKWRGGVGGGWRAYAAPVVVLGVINSALPFCLFAFATLTVTAGFAAILNATAPFFSALVARVWLGERLPWPRVAGLVVGFGGVVVLVGGAASTKGGDARAVVLAVGAGLLAGLLYGVAANYTKRRAAGLDPLVLAAGSQVAAAALLLPPAVVMLAGAPARPSGAAWAMAAALGVFCTAVAYVLYFRLLASAGPSRAIAVTFLIPLFAMVWGFVFLREAATPRMLVGMGMVLMGTGLTTGVVRVGRGR